MFVEVSSGNVHFSPFLITAECMKQFLVLVFRDSRFDDSDAFSCTSFMQQDQLLLLTRCYLYSYKMMIYIDRLLIIYQLETVEITLT